MDEQDNADEIEDQDIQHETLNQVDAQESDVNKISVDLIDDWKEFDKYLMLNNLELYDSMRFKIDDIFNNADKATLENQHKYKDFIERFHHKDCSNKD